VAWGNLSYSKRKLLRKGRPERCQSCRAVRPGGKSKWVSDLRGDWPKRNAAQLHKPDLPEILSGLASQITPVIE
jgi:hypothetical protein